MRYEVLLTEGAERDVAEIYRYISETDSRDRADRWLERLLRAATALTEVAERGAYPKELLALGIRDYRQVLVGSYRVIYRVRDERVFIYLVADNRRDMQALLQRRLLGA
jgi:toxin ParE1/3/4